MRHIAPHDRPAYVEQLIERQAARRAAELGPADLTPPVITGFVAGTKLDLTKPAAPFKITVKATDDLSGVRHCCFYAYGPHGQTMYLGAGTSIPRVDFNVVSGHSGGISRLHEPGAWKFKNGYCYDANNNFVSIDEAGLDALGNTAFTVVSAGYELHNPTLSGGKVPTSAVSLSAHATGTTNVPPYVGARLDLADTGDTAIAGVAYAYAYFCLVANPNACINLFGYMEATGMGAASVIAGTQVSAAWGYVPGDYALESVSVYDYSGNYNSYLGTLFGGTTDFAPMFGGVAPKIKLQP